MNHVRRLQNLILVLSDRLVISIYFDLNSNRVCPELTTVPDNQPGVKTENRKLFCQITLIKPERIVHKNIVYDAFYTIHGTWWKRKDCQI